MSVESAHSTDFHAIVLAAGRGTRMGPVRGDAPKVLMPLCGRPMLAYVLDVLREAGVSRPIIVVGKDGGAVRETFGDACECVVQEEQLGSGHAVLCAREAARGSRHVLVMCGDSPLFRTETVRPLMDAHVRGRAALTVVSAVLDDPTGYGRILRAPNGDVTGIVEEKLASPEQRAIREVNGGCYALDAEWLWGNLAAMRRNDAGEYCLTEMVGVAIAQGRGVIAVSAPAAEILGVNTPAQLQRAEEALRARLRR